MVVNFKHSNLSPLSLACCTYVDQKRVSCSPSQVFSANWTYLVETKPALDSPPCLHIKVLRKFLGVVLWYTPILAFRLAEAEQLFVTLQYQFRQFIIGDVVRRLYVVLWLTIGKA